MAKLVTIISLLLLLLSSQRTEAQSISETSRQISNLIGKFPGEVGVCMISDLGDTVRINENQHFPLLSVMKFHQALAISHKYSQSQRSLDRKIRVKSKELMPETWSPMHDRNPDGGKYSIAQLMMLSLLESDNNASNILFDKVVSVGETNEFIHSIGINDCAVMTDERGMAKDLNACYDNWSTPMSAAKLLEWFYENRNSDKYNERVWNAMTECKTGQSRIPRYLNGATIAHKTGTGPVLADGSIMAVNDAACVTFPDAHHYTIAVFIKNAHCNMTECEALIADISRLCFGYYTKRK